MSTPRRFSCHLNVSVLFLLLLTTYLLILCVVHTDFNQTLLYKYEDVDFNQTSLYKYEDVDFNPDLSFSSDVVRFVENDLINDKSLHVATRRSIEDISALGQQGRDKVRIARPATKSEDEVSGFDLPVNEPGVIYTKPHYFLLVLVMTMCNSDLRMNLSREHWNNESYYRSQGVSLKILYVVGRHRDQHSESLVTEDVLEVDVMESRANLTLKVKESLRLIQNLYSFEYVLKTDIDVFNNYTRWEEMIKKKVIETETPPLYGGATCNRHINLPFQYCSGYSYILHHSVVRYVVEQPREKMLLSEDQNTGRVMWEHHVTDLLKGGGEPWVHYRDCGVNLLRSRVAVHLGYYIKHVRVVKMCWDKVLYGEVQETDKF